MPRYLSLDWIDELRAEVDRSESLRTAAAGRTLGVTEVVTSGPEGDVTYHLRVEDRKVSFGAGPAEDEDVRLVQDWDTAVAVATGTLSAQEAFLAGRIRFHGNHQVLLDNQPVFSALEDVFAAVRPRTEYR